jgi:hypothetical protein
MISTYELARHHGLEPDALRAQILATVGYALGQQLRADVDHDVPAAADADGAIPSSPLDRTVRIDFVQHVCSAMLRAAALVPG